MTDFFNPVYLIDRLAVPPCSVDAFVTWHLGSDIAVKLEAEWSHLRNMLDVRAEHLHWNWRNKTEAIDRGSVRIAAITCRGKFQGALAVDAQPYGNSVGQPCLYVSYVESAPWNLPGILSGFKQFHGVGATLIAVAVRESLRLGWQGRIALHSLPSSESFYREALKMKLIPHLPDAQGLKRFEYNEEDARKFLEGRL